MCIDRVSIVGSAKAKDARSIREMLIDLKIAWPSARIVHSCSTPFPPFQRLRFIGTDLGLRIAEWDLFFAGPAGPSSKLPQGAAPDVGNKRSECAQGRERESRDRTIGERGPSGNAEAKEEGVGDETDGLVGLGRRVGSSNSLIVNGRCRSFWRGGDHDYDVHDRELKDHVSKKPLDSSGGSPPEQAHDWDRDASLCCHCCCYADTGVPGLGSSRAY